VSLDAFRRYFAPGGDAWPYERQALVKLRPIAGDVKLGQQIIKLRDEFIYNDDPFDIAAMRAMRERQIRHHVTAGTVNAKLSPGGLVDIEYLVQGLQISYGHRYPNLRVTNTSEALTALAAVGVLTQQDYVHLSEALSFLQNLINALRMVRGNTKDLTVPPIDSEEFVYLARRMRYEAGHQVQLNYDLTNHTTRVQEINARILN
ncbi:MAG TPA: glutamine synthetase adenylyltransferase, partial [Anaerolineae bacterium]|nr:glutamine synthetase adenylyltransferase [Anaerolineae bacterium]